MKGGMRERGFLSSEAWEEREHDEKRKEGEGVVCAF